MAAHALRPAVRRLSTREIVPGPRIMTESVRAFVDGRIGRLVLSRPAALNALDREMIRALTASLQIWQHVPEIHAVVIEGEGRAFCAGGDIRAIRDAAVAGDSAAIEAFFGEEYALNRVIAEYAKPYVALVDGICMGGGIGVCVHGRFRVATEAAMFAMPETGIALFPDVGATYFLPRLPGALGMFLGLTGTRLAGADAVHAGLATHFVPKAKLQALSAAIATDGVASLAEFAEAPPPFTLAAELPAINRCFSAGSLAEILQRLTQEGAWGEKIMATLRAMSPSSVLWSFGIVHRGAARDLPACLTAELRLTRHVTRHPDFVEGVRAMVIDKDRIPKWSPSAIEEVDARAIAEMLE
jgi:enoyl-CoA hydratase/carnithine racemase